MFCNTPLFSIPQPMKSPGDVISDAKSSKGRPKAAKKLCLVVCDMLKVIVAVAFRRLKNLHSAETNV